MMKTKIRDLESFVEKAEEKFVPANLFEATIAPLREDIHEIKNDLKSLVNRILEIEPRGNDEENH